MGVINDAHHLTEVVQTLKQGDIKLSRKMELWRLCVLLALISGIKAPVPLSDNSLSEEDHYKDGQIPTNDVNDGQIPAFDVNDGKISAFDVQDKFDRETVEDKNHVEDEAEQTMEENEDEIDDGYYDSEEDVMKELAKKPRDPWWNRRRRAWRAVWRRYRIKIL